MRHSKRDFLKTDDVKLAMDKLSINVNTLNFKLLIIFGL